MTQILITWREIDDHDLPRCCMTCVREAVDIVPRTLITITIPHPVEAQTHR